MLSGIGDPTGTDWGTILPVLGAVVATFLASYFTFKGKTQDTANWLIVELRNDAKSAREDAAEAKALFAECELHRDEDRQLHVMELDELRGQIAELRARYETG